MFASSKKFALHNIYFRNSDENMYFGYVSFLLIKQNIVAPIPFHENIVAPISFHENIVAPISFHENRKTGGTCYDFCDVDTLQQFEQINIQKTKNIRNSNKVKTLEWILA